MSIHRAGPGRQDTGIAAAIAAAGCTLLGGGLLSGEAAASDEKWQLDTALMYYREVDRVTAIEPVLNLRHELGDEEFVSVKLVLDSLTGAAPNGAPVRPYAQTFTTPSGAAGGGGGGEDEDEDEDEGGGSGGYTAAPNTVPLDDSFMDTRTAVSVNWDRPLSNRLWRMGLGVNASQEHDFFSLGASGTLSRDFNKRNTTVTGGLSFESDLINPEGGIPVPMTLMDDALTSAAEETRTVTDVLVGVTQVLGRNTVAQLNYSVSISSGYHNDPYKLVANDAAGGPPGEFWYEARPDSRMKHAIYGELKHAVGSDVLAASYRYMTDDWGVDSHTVDLRYRWLLGEEWFLEPHARWYTQTAADFWVEALPSAPAPDQLASGDYRLGALVDTSLGLKLGKHTSETGDAYVKVETLQQTGDTEPANMTALVVEFGYSFSW